MGNRIEPDRAPISRPEPPPQAPAHGRRVQAQGTDGPGIGPAVINSVDLAAGQRAAEAGAGHQPDPIGLYRAPGYLRRHPVEPAPEPPEQPIDELPDEPIDGEPIDSVPDDPVTDLPDEPTDDVPVAPPPADSGGIAPDQPTDSGGADPVVGPVTGDGATEPPPDGSVVAPQDTTGDSTPTEPSVDSTAGDVSTDASPSPDAAVTQPPTTAEQTSEGTGTVTSDVTDAASTTGDTASPEASTSAEMTTVASTPEPAAGESGPSPAPADTSPSSTSTDAVVQPAEGEPAPATTTSEPSAPSSSTDPVLQPAATEPTVAPPAPSAPSIDAVDPAAATRDVRHSIKLSSLLEVSALDGGRAGDGTYVMLSWRQDRTLGQGEVRLVNVATGESAKVRLENFENGRTEQTLDFQELGIRVTIRMKRAGRRLGAARLAGQLIGDSVSVGNTSAPAMRRGLALRAAVRALALVRSQVSSTATG